MLARAGIHNPESVNMDFQVRVLTHAPRNDTVSENSKRSGRLHVGEEVAHLGFQTLGLDR
jgi:hypothetical protein